MPPFQGFLLRGIIAVPGLTPLGCTSSGPLGLQLHNLGISLIVRFRKY
jgi:hypothetical protein